MYTHARAEHISVHAYECVRVCARARAMFFGRVSRRRRRRRRRPRPRQRRRRHHHHTNPIPSMCARACVRAYACARTGWHTIKRNRSRASAFSSFLPRPPQPAPPPPPSPFWAVICLIKYVCMYTFARRRRSSEMRTRTRSQHQIPKRWMRARALTRRFQAGDLAHVRRRRGRRSTSDVRMSFKMYTHTYVYLYLFCFPPWCSLVLVAGRTDGRAGSTLDSNYLCASGGGEAHDA